MPKTSKTFRFDSDIIKEAEIIASKERRSLNNWIEVLIEKEIRLKKEAEIKTRPIK